MMQEEETSVDTDLVFIQEKQSVIYQASRFAWGRPRGQMVKNSSLCQKYVITYLSRRLTLQYGQYCYGNIDIPKCRRKVVDIKSVR